MSPEIIAERDDSPAQLRNMLDHFITIYLSIIVHILYMSKVLASVRAAGKLSTCKEPANPGKPDIPGT